MEALQKFMRTLGMTDSLEISREYYSGRQNNCCIRVEVRRDGKEEYIQYHCYSLRSNGNIKYEEGNEVLGIQDGVLAYLGMDREIDNYFETRARELARKCLEQNNF